MRWSQTFISTMKETPQEAEIASHALMIRAGLIQKLSSGLYIYMPLCLKVLEKISTIIRSELSDSGAIEILMPALQPKEIWQQSGRWDKMGELMMKVTDREERTFVLGPTHEEIVTHLVSKKINSYRDLPVNFFQIQTKFRDEIRPRYGLMRTREFIMKDGYSFDTDEEGLNNSYVSMYKAYEKIFARCGLDAVPVLADTGVMGGNESHEFMVLAAAGEDKIVMCPSCGYASNMELAVRKPQAGSKAENSGKEMEELHTPDLKRIEELEQSLGKNADQFIKTLVYTYGKKAVVVLIRGDLEVQDSKLANYLQTGNLELADDATVEETTGAPTGFAGPINLPEKTRIVADISVQGMSCAVTGANKKDYHFVNVNEGRDFTVKAYADIAKVKAGDLCTKCSGPLEIKNGIEVGQVFKLGTKYSKSIGAKFVDADGKQQPAVMGCYGIGVSRTLAAIVEANSDDKGIVWPVNVAPFQILVLPLNLKNEELVKAAEKIYEELKAKGYDVLIDDRADLRPGFKFKDADLIGFPIQIALGDKSFKDGKAEIQARKIGQKQLVDVSDAVAAAEALFKEIS